MILLHPHYDLLGLVYGTLNWHTHMREMRFRNRYKIHSVQFELFEFASDHVWMV